MIEITKEQWNNIHSDYKGKWEESIRLWQPDLPVEYIGKRTVMSGCISNKLSGLLTEDIHFKIV